MSNAAQHKPDRRNDSHALIVRPSGEIAPPPARRGPSDPASSGGLGPREVLVAIRHWWRVALPAGIALASIAGVVVYLLFVPQYETSAWLHISEQAPYLAFETEDGINATRSFVQTQVELLRSPKILQLAIADPVVSRVQEIAEEEDPVEWLSENISVAPVGRSELYRVTFRASDPEGAAAVVNAVVLSFFENDKAERAEQLEGVLQSLINEEQFYLAEVEKLRHQVRELAQEVTGRDPFQANLERTVIAEKPIGDLANRLSAAEVEESIAEAKLKAVEATQPQDEVPNAVIDRLVAESPEVIRANESLAELKSQLSAIESRATRGKEDSLYQRLAGLVGQEEQTLEDLKKALSEQIRANLQVTEASRSAEEVTKLRSELEFRRVAKELLEQRYGDELKSVQHATGETIDLRFQQEELARKERVLELISARIVMLKTEKGAPRQIRTHLKASVPVVPIKAFPYANFLVAVVGGLCLPFGMAVLKEQMTARISDAESAERQTQLAVIGETARLPTRKLSARLGNRELSAARLFEESIDALRTSLLLSNHDKPLRVAAVTSAVNKEGKTSVAVQLAISLACAYREQTLVIDADVRDPSIHKVLRIPNDAGLVQVLSGTCSLQEAIAPTWAGSVYAVPAGELKGNPHALFADGRWEQLLKAIPPEFRFIIIDTPPVLLASEALVLARGADTVLMCAMRDVTRSAHLKKATQRISATGAKVAGIVLNGVPASEYAGHYGTYSYVKR